MGKTGKAKTVSVDIPCRLYAAILQDLDARPRAMSVETAVQECIRGKYGKTRVRREYLVRAGNEMSDAPEKPPEPAHRPVGAHVQTVYEMDPSLAASRRKASPGERKQERRRVRDNFSSQLAMMTGGRH